MMVEAIRRWANGGPSTRRPSDPRREYMVLCARDSQALVEAAHRAAAQGWSTVSGLSVDSASASGELTWSQAMSRSVDQMPTSHHRTHFNAPSQQEVLPC